MDTPRNKNIVVHIPQETMEVNPQGAKMNFDFKNQRVEIELDDEKIHASVELLEKVLANENKMTHWKHLTRCCFRNKK